MVEYSPDTIEGYVRVGMDKTRTTKQRGDALEDLFRYLLDLVPGVMTQANGIDPFKGAEIDIAVANTQSAQWMQVLPACFLVECKNWDERVGVKEIQAFETKLRHRGVTLGIVVAASGVTGDQHNLTAAYFNIAMSQQSGLRILVVTLEDLRSLKTTDELTALLCRCFLKCVASGKF